MNEREVKKHLQIVLDTHGENPNSLSRKCGTNQKTLNNQINGETSVSLSTILLILEALPDVSAEWLLRGSGDMLLGDGKTGGHIATNSHIVTNSHYETHTGSTLPEDLVRDILAKKDEQIQALLELLRQ